MPSSLCSTFVSQSRPSWSSNWPLFGAAP
jgi:hypothetical protein